MTQLKNFVKGFANGFIVFFGVMLLMGIFFPSPLFSLGWGDDPVAHAQERGAKWWWE